MISSLARLLNCGITSGWGGGSGQGNLFFASTRMCHAVLAHPNQSLVSNFASNAPDASCSPGFALDATRLCSTDANWCCGVDMTIGVFSDCLIASIARGS